MVGGLREVGFSDFDGPNPISWKWFWIVRVAGARQRRAPGWERLSAAELRGWQAEPAPLLLSGVAALLGRGDSYARSR